MVKLWDVIIIGAGIIGLSLAIELNKRGLRVLVVDKGEPGREASWAAGGMLADFPLEMPAALGELASASARMYPEFVHELEDESRLKIDLRSEGALVFIDPALHQANNFPKAELTQSLVDVEPNLASAKLAAFTALFLKERSVDPRHLTAAAHAAAKHRGIDFSSGDRAIALETVDGTAGGVRTTKTSFASKIVVNCAGAWSGQIAPHTFPTRPVKGQMLCVVMPQKDTIRHVIRTPSVYLIPRSDGRLLIGATQEEAGFDKQTVPEAIQKLRQQAIEIAPKLADARILEA